MADPQSVDEWLQLVEQHELSARVLSKNKLTAAQGYFHSGIAVECMLKAYIMRKERLNAFPSKQARKELYTHDVRKLKKIAGIVSLEKDINAPQWFLVEAWDRLDGYSPKFMPKRVANDFYETVFGKDGVVTWLKSNMK